jgi:hypothetical protein
MQAVGSASNMEEEQIGRQPAGLSSVEAEMQCCCGRQDCVFLKHNCAVLDNLEHDVHNAARMGQVGDTGCIPAASMTPSLHRHLPYQSLRPHPFAA